MVSLAIGALGLLSPPFKLTFSPDAPLLSRESGLTVREVEAFRLEVPIPPTFFATEPPDLRDSIESSGLSLFWERSLLLASVAQLI